MNKWTINDISRIVGLVVVACAVIAYAVTLRSDVNYIKIDVAEIRADLKLSNGDQWTRTDHDNWIGQDFKPLENQVQRVEVKVGLAKP